MSVDLARLRELAGKATPGPWIRSGVRQTINENCIMVGPDEFLILAIPHGRHPKHHAGAFNDAGFIAACDPQTILSLLDRLAALETVAETTTKMLELQQRARDHVMAHALGSGGDLGKSQRLTEGAIKAEIQVRAALSALEKTNAT